MSLISPSNSGAVSGQILHVPVFSSRKEGGLGSWWGQCAVVLASLGSELSYILSLSCVQLFATSQTVARQAPVSMGFSRQEYWSALPFPSPGGLLDPRVKCGSPALQADSLPPEPPGKPSKRVSQELKENIDDTGVLS